jgi:chorismate-pyruvate lyase
MLLGDGSPTRHLRLLTGHPVAVRMVAMEPEPEVPGTPRSQLPREVRELEPPLLRRQVWLDCGGQTLAWAESWWNQKAAEQHLRDRTLPIWLSLTQGRSELFREVDGLALVQSDWLEEGFEAKGPFWSRHYRFFREGRELTVIREVFSPRLEQWLGPAPRQTLHLTS